ncbi:recombination directionality factor [Streptomyces sparsogenes]|uniref:recombination directionality factor n=1 Tax=Streptomyces sparsogenes TaxID=67365 RepID=UPI0033E9FF81
MANNIKRIWDTDPESKPKERTFSDDFVGRFRSGRLVGKQPEALSEWRVTTGDPVVAEEISRLMGGEAAEWDTDKEDNIEVLTDSASVEIIIESSDKIDASMKLFGMSGLVHHCDGVEFLSPEEDRGQKCGCPALLQDRKDKAKSGRGPKPSIDLTFKLAGAPELGVFRFNSGSWELVKVLHTVLADVDRAAGREYGDDGNVTVPGVPVRAILAIERVEYTTRAGRDVSFNRPVVKVLGAYEAAESVDVAKAA